jgi:hypothetical protein
MKEHAAGVRATYEEEISHWRKVSEKSADQRACEVQLEAQLAFAASEYAAGNRKEAAVHYATALTESQRLNSLAEQFDDHGVYFRQLLAYQRLASPAIKWRDVDEARELLVGLFFGRPRLSFSTDLFPYVQVMRRRRSST